ncbi:hypothetical protein [Chroococcidiopsis sp.]|uniref:hypothetical protein n=1 Tax=Chroococcidiopsis sp. TaxID=3088168 RepID=UPI003F37C194
MSINFSAKSDKYPAKLWFSDEKITPTDRIVFSEVYFKVSDDSISLCGFLSSQSIGLTNYKDKDWKPEGQEALLTIYKSKKQQWNDSIKKFEAVDVSASESYLFNLVSAKLKTFDPLACVCLSLVPYISPMFFDILDDQTKPGLDEATFQVQAKMLEKIVENTCVVAVGTTQRLTDEHRSLLNKTTASGSGNSWGGSKSETEAEKLEARWLFIKKHLSSVGQFETIGDIAIAITNAPDQLSRDRLCETISTLSQLLP